MAQHEHRHVVDRAVVGQRADDDVGGDGGDDQRPQAFDGHRAQHDLGHEQRAGDGRVVGGGDAGRRAAGDVEPAARHRHLAPAADQRAGQRGQLHHRAFAADGAAAGHGGGGRQARAAPRRARRARRCPAPPPPCSRRRRPARAGGAPRPAAVRRRGRRRPARSAAATTAGRRRCGPGCRCCRTSAVRSAGSARGSRWCTGRPARRPARRRPAWFARPADAGARPRAGAGAQARHGRFPDAARRPVAG